MKRRLPSPVNTPNSAIGLGERLRRKIGAPRRSKFHFQVRMQRQFLALSSHNGTLIAAFSELRIMIM
jgi:hypothetical protein